MNKKRVWIGIGGIVYLVIVYIAVTSYLNYRTRHQEPWKLVADCELGRVTRMNFGSAITAPDGRYVNEEKFAVLAKSNAVEPGMSRKKVMKLIGDPSFVEGTTSEDDGKFSGCEWHYVFAGRKEDTGYFTEQEALTITFDELGDVKSRSEKKRY